MGTDSEEKNKAITKSIISKCLSFCKLLSNKKINNVTDIKIEVLSFYIFFAVDGFQKSGFDNKFIDNFMTNFYQELSKNGVLNHLESLKTLELNIGNRWPIFFTSLGEREAIERDYDTKRVLKLVSRESFYLDYLINRPDKFIQFDSDEMFSNPSNDLPDINKELLIAVNQIMLEVAVIER